MDYIIKLVFEGVIESATGCTRLQMRHTRVASRLQRELGANLPGVALALRLLEELETVRAQIASADGYVPRTLVDSGGIFLEVLWGSH
jgi:chaperone modulatory protein CbpM